MNTQLPTIVQRLWNYCNVLRAAPRLDSERAVPGWNDIESAVEVGLKRARRLRQAVLRSAFEGRLR